MRRYPRSRGDEMLGVYLNDQLALGLAWRAMAVRAAHNNHGTTAELDLKMVAEAIADDDRAFREIMRRLSIKESRFKKAAAVIAERIGRLKPNGRLVAYSPLSRFFELEALCLGIEAKKQLWETLAELDDFSSRFPDLEFPRLVHRAEAQRKILQPLRQTAAELAFLPSQSSATA